MSRNITALCAGIVSLLPGAVCAQVVITEIMYDLPDGSDSGREWVEVYNAGATPVPLATWKLYENGTNHKITSVSGDSMLAPQSYAVIADNPAHFRVDWPQFSGQLFDSAFSLSNSGETIALRNASSSDMDTASYQSSSGGAGDGNSLNRAQNNASFVPRRPSPGAAMSPDAISAPPPPAALPKASAKKINPQPAPQESVLDVVADIPDAASSATESASVEVAAAGSVSQSGSTMWWAAAAGLAVAAGGSLVAARRLGKKEWNIIEEK